MHTVQYYVTDDNIAEPDELLTLSIVRSLASNQIPVEYVVQRVNVTLVDNDSECVNNVPIRVCACLCYIYVTARFTT